MPAIPDTSSISTDLYDACRYFAWPPGYRNVGASAGWGGQQQGLSSSFSSSPSEALLAPTTAQYGGASPSYPQAPQDGWAFVLQRTSPAMSPSSSLSSSSLAGAMDLPPEMANGASSSSQLEYQHDAFSPSTGYAPAIPPAEIESSSPSLVGSLIVPRSARYSQGPQAPQTQGHHRSWSSPSSLPQGPELQYQTPSQPQSQLKPWPQAVPIPTSLPTTGAVDPLPFRGWSSTDDQAHPEVAYRGHQSYSAAPASASELINTFAPPSSHYQRAAVRTRPTSFASSAPSHAAALPHQHHDQFRIVSPASVDRTLNATQQRMLAMAMLTPEPSSRPSSTIPALVPISTHGALTKTVPQRQLTPVIQYQAQNHPVIHQQQPQQARAHPYSPVHDHYQDFQNDASTSESSPHPPLHIISSNDYGGTGSRSVPSPGSSFHSTFPYAYTEGFGTQGFDYSVNVDQRFEDLQQSTMLEGGTPHWVDQFAPIGVDTAQVDQNAIRSSSLDPRQQYTAEMNEHAPEPSDVAAMTSTDRKIMRARAAPSMPRVGLRQRKPPPPEQLNVTTRTPSGAVRPRKIYPARALPVGVTHKGPDVHISHRKRAFSINEEDQGQTGTNLDDPASRPPATKRSKRNVVRAFVIEEDSEDKDDEHDEQSGYDDDVGESSYAAMFSHVHVMNIPCPHPACSLTAGADGRERSRKWNFKPGEKRKPKGVKSPVTSKTRDVSDQKLDMGLARRLLWESIRVVETSDWSCLYIEENQRDNSPAPTTAIAIKAKISAGEISSQHAAQSVYVQRSQAEKRIETEFDIDVLKRQAEEVKKALLALGVGETANGSENPSSSGTCQKPVIVPVDLGQAEVFKRLALRRAWTFERYFCPERSCDVDFTRLDALLRHCHNSHGEKKKKRAEREDVKRGRKPVSASGKARKGKLRKDDSEAEWEDTSD
ncbi:hypothetical protein FRB97_009109 [Tulasnella sp. 331]|nr:hypothetical protein FRB97_009109 [Tulasnella sp. 331]